MKARMSFAAVAILSLLFSPLALSPAEAAARKATSVTIKVSDATVQAGDRVTFAGQASPRKAGSIVKLQKRRGSTWVTVKRDRLNRARAYGFRVTAPQGKTAYRVVAPAVRYAKPAVSRALTVAAVAEQETPPTNPTAPAPELTPELISAYQGKMLEQLNAYRAAHGAAPLTLLAGANELAQARAQAVYSGTSESQLASISPFMDLLGPGAIRFCEGWDYTAATGPDTHENPDYLMDAEYAAVGYYYDAEVNAGKPAVWTIYVMDSDA